MTERLLISTVCVNYVDELSKTYYYNKRIYSQHDYWVITIEEDIDTINFCKENSIHFYTTNAFYENGPFNKARSINKFFQDEKDNILKNDWILLTDADMICDKPLELWLNNKQETLRQKDTLYSFKREFILDNGTLESPKPEDIFYGFFQLFHKNNIEHLITNGFLYETGDCSYYDYIFQRLFNQKILLSAPNNLIHIGDPNKNWKGKQPKTNN